ncbi:MAG: translation elongation factor Ts [bacterium]|nr:translation elongation factor Ts [bacterium]
MSAGVKLLCETDFVAKNDTFVGLLDTLLDKLFDKADIIDSLANADKSFVTELTTLVAEYIGKIGENVQLADIMTSKEKAYAYNHPGNKVAALVFYTGDDENIAKEIALQVAAMDPQYLSIEDVPADRVASMKAEFSKDLLKSGKPENIIEQILKGKMQKAFSEFVLLEQSYIRDGAKSVKDIIPEGFVVSKYLRYAI